MNKIITKRLEIFKANDKYVDVFLQLLLDFDREIPNNSVYMKDMSENTLRCLIEDSIENGVFYVVRERETHTVVGSFSIEDKEAGGWIRPDKHGLGYGREGFGPFIDACLKELSYVTARHHDQLVCNTFKKCGMEYIGNNRSLMVYSM